MVRWFTSKRPASLGCLLDQAWKTMAFLTWASSKVNHERHFRILGRNNLFATFVLTWGQKLLEVPELNPEFQISSQMFRPQEPFVC